MAVVRHNTRLEWWQVPPGVRAAVDELLGSRIVTAINAAGGFSPGPAVTCTLANGTRAFVKACSSDANSFTPAMHRREAEVLRKMPSHFPVPGLIGVVDAENWVALVIEHVEGRMPVAPLSENDVKSVLRLVEVLAELGTPSPIQPLGAVGPAERDHGGVHSWPTMVEEGLVDRLDDWSLRHIERLVDVEAGWTEAVSGTSLLHGDLRTDNILITADRSMVVDWPAAGIGAAWVDLVGLLPALHVDGGPSPVSVFGRHPVGRTSDRERVDSYICALAGYFTRQSLLPPAPGIAAVRSFQGAQGAVTRQWLAERLRLA